MRPELDFALERQIRDIPNMGRNELVGIIDVLAQHSRDAHKVIGDFQDIANEQSKMITDLVQRLQKRK